MTYPWLWHLEMSSCHSRGIHDSLTMLKLFESKRMSMVTSKVAAGNILFFTFSFHFSVSIFLLLFLETGYAQNLCKCVNTCMLYRGFQWSRAACKKGVWYNISTTSHEEIKCAFKVASSVCAHEANGYTWRYSHRHICIHVNVLVRTYL